MRPTGLVIMSYAPRYWVCHAERGSMGGARGDRIIRSVRGCVVESDFAPDIEGLLQRTTSLGGASQYVGAFVADVPALVACLDHHFQRHAVGHGTGLDA